MWKKSILWELPYWDVLEVRNAIDVMHLTKNLCVNLLGFLGTYGQSKDTLTDLIICCRVSGETPCFLEELEASRRLGRWNSKCIAIRLQSHSLSDVYCSGFSDGSN